MRRNVLVSIVAVLGTLAAVASGCFALGIAQCYTGFQGSTCLTVYCPNGHKNVDTATVTNVGDRTICRDAWRDEQGATWCEDDPLKGFCHYECTNVPRCVGCLIENWSVAMIGGPNKKLGSTVCVGTVDNPYE